MMVQVAQRSTVQRFGELQSANARLQKELSQARLQLTKIADDKKAAAMYEKKRIADRLQRRPERNKAFKVELNKSKSAWWSCFFFFFLFFPVLHQQGFQDPVLLSVRGVLLTKDWEIWPFRRMSNWARLQGGRGEGEGKKKKKQKPDQGIHWCMVMGALNNNHVLRCNVHVFLCVNMKFLCYSSRQFKAVPQASRLLHRKPKLAAGSLAA